MIEIYDQLNSLTLLTTFKHKKGTGGFSEQGSSHNMLLLYEHKLQRSSYNMVIGPFGQASKRDFFCVQSLDGTLAFFEQENFAFIRFLPNHLLPTPIDYSRTSDSFVLSSSSWTLESYRYQVLAIARDEEDSRQDNRLDGRQMKDGNVPTGGRRISPDWNVVLGESALDLKIVMLEGSKTEVVVVLGERNLFVMDIDGSNCRISLRFDFCPTCMHSYSCNGNLILLIASEFNTIHIFKDSVLVWAAQTSFPPIAIRRAQVAACPGIIVTLSDSGQLCCSYLGSNPSINVVTISSQNEPDDRGEEEMNRLKKVINSMEEELSSMIAGHKKHHVQTDVVIEVEKIEFLDKLKHGENNNLPSNRSAIIPIKLDVKSRLSDVRLTFDASTPFVVKMNVVTFPVLESQSVNRTAIEVETANKHLPSSMKVVVTTTFNDSSGAPRVLLNSCHLPLDLVVKSSKPSKENKYNISLDVICSNQISLTQIFSDLSSNEEFSSKKELGIEFLVPQIPLVTVTVTSKSPKQTFRVMGGCFEGVAFITTELIRRLQSQHIKFDAAVIDKETGLQLKSYFTIIDQHHKIRKEILDAENCLAKLMVQLRTIEKRFLIKLKDRNPAPLNDVDLLLSHTSSRVM